MKILLVQLPHYFGENSRPPSFFPIGLGHIATTLKNSGHEVGVFDIWAHQIDKDTVRKKVQKMEYDVVGISAFCTQYNYAKWFAQVIKNERKPMIMGGPLATFSYKVVLDKTDVNYCVIAEGENTIVDLVDNIESPSSVKGIAFKDGDHIRLTESRPPIKNLDDIPFPAWDEFPMEIYLKHCYLRDTPSLTSLNVVCGRGCPYNCNYCSRTFSGTRLRSVENIGEEIALLKKKYKIKGIFFNDELAIINKKRTYELGDMLRSLNLKWQCQGRVNLVDEELLRHMKKSGCVGIGYGLESGSQRILDNMNKKATVKQAEDAIKATYKVGILPIIQMMFGYPGENDESIRDTIKFFERTKAHYFSSLSVTTPLPGTQLYEDCLEKGLIEDEEELLKNLDAGYSGDRDFLINFTEWSDEELYRKKRETERVLWHLSKKHHYSKYVRHIMSDAIAYARLFGWLVTIKKGLSKRGGT